MVLFLVVPVMCWIVVMCLTTCLLCWPGGAAGWHVTAVSVFCFCSCGRRASSLSVVLAVFLLFKCFLTDAFFPMFGCHQCFCSSSGFLTNAFFLCFLCLTVTNDDLPYTDKS